MRRGRWLLLIGVFVVGIGVWLFGAGVGIVAAAVALLAMVALAWIDVSPHGGHVHDTGMLGRGVPDPPEFTHLRRR